LNTDIRIYSYRTIMIMVIISVVIMMIITFIATIYADLEGKSLRSQTDIGWL